MINRYLKQLSAGLLLAATFNSAALADEQLHKIENAYQAADSAKLATLSEGIDGKNLLVAQYRLISLMLGNQQMEEAKALLNELKANLNTATQTNPDNAEAWALMASTFGMLSSMDPEKAMDYGIKAGEAEARALATGPENPMVQLLIGINKFYTPEQWGGGKVTALKYFDSAVNAYQAGELDRSWGHADALVWRGSTHAKLGNKDQARADVDAAIAMAPDYQWAKNALNYL